MSEINRLTAVELAALLEKREISARELAEAALFRIEEVDTRVRAFITVTAEAALAKAEDVDNRRVRGLALGPLAGIPVAYKDNLCTVGIRTTCGSRILPEFRPPYDATVVDRLHKCDTVPVGKTNCDEFAMGSSTENSGFGPTHNPWNLDCVPGGSSGGSTAAVAAGESVVALGSDTGGSIRQPASLCGVVGLKPSYGRVSRYGLVAYASSLDQIGPITRCVEDAALLLDAISGPDPLDSTSVDLPVPAFRAACRHNVSGLRIGVPIEYFNSVDSVVRGLVREAIDKLCALGATAEECSLPTTDYALAAYYVLAPAEASSNLARYDGVRYGHRTREMAGHIGLMEKSRDEGFGEEVKQRIMIGAFALSAGYYDAYYKRAQQVRTLIRREFDRAFEKFDVLITPTSPTVAFKLGSKTNDPLEMKRADVCTLPVNMAGLPAISVPCGFFEGLPVGLQMIGQPFDELTVLRAAFTYEQAAGWHRAHPSL